MSDTFNIHIQLNYFGPYLTRDEMKRIIGIKPTTGGILGHSALLIESFFDLPFESLSEKILQRDIEATPEELHLPIVPHTKEIFERLLKPLKSAKKNYCLGDYSATIALCGIVGEMLAMLLWKINGIKINDSLMNEVQEKALFGSTFEKLGQDRRLEVLKVYRLIDQGKYDKFKDIKNGRRPYLHLWSSNFNNEMEESLQLFKKALSLFKDITGVGLLSGREIKINPLLLKLLERLDEV